MHARRNVVKSVDIERKVRALVDAGYHSSEAEVTIESAKTNHCEELIYPKEFMADTIAPVITDISVICLTHTKYNFHL